MADAANASWAGRLQDAWLTRGPLALCLLPVAGLFAMVSGLHRILFRSGVRHPQRLPVPVIVVGNLVAGGAGKTPTSIALVHRLRELGHRPGVISRGYGRRDDAVLDVTADTPVEQAGDEPLLMHLRTGVPVVVGADRVDAGRQLLARHPEVDVLVSDDGLQHHRLSRDVQVLVFDERGAGNGWLLPAGPLREPMPPRLPAHTLVVYNAPAASTALPGFVAARSLRGVVSLADWWQGRVASRDALIGLRGRPMLAVAGLARPGRFFDMLRAQGLTLSTLALPDHHDYAVTPWPATAPDVVVTEKDAVKLRPGRVGATRVWVATLDFSLGAEFDAALMQWLAPPSPRQTGNDHGNTTARPAGVPAVQGPAGAPAPADERAP